MHTFIPRAASRLTLAATMLLCGGLAGCGGGSDDNGETSGDTATLGGTAAFGAPIAGGSVEVHCAGGKFTFSATNANGVFSGQVPTAALPCAVKVSGGNLPADYGALHSLATATGTVNITPLTDLALALAVNDTAGQQLTAWFADTANLASVATGLTDALDTLRTALIAAGYDVPESWTAGSSTPATDSFTPDPATDAYDALLEAIAEAIDASATITDYAALLASFVAGGGLPSAVEPTTPPVGEGLQFQSGTVTPNRIMITLTGTLAGPDPTWDRNALYLHAPGNWIEYPVDPQAIQVTGTFTGTPVTGKTVAGVYAYDSVQNSQSMKAYGDYIQINFGGTNLAANTDTGSQTSFVIEFPQNVILPSLTTLSLSWGMSSAPNFGPFQGAGAVTISQ